MTYGARSYGARSYGDATLAAAIAGTPTAPGELQTILAGGVADGAAVGLPNVVGLYTLLAGGAGDGSAVGAPVVYLPLTILAGSVLSAPVVGKPTITLPSAPAPETRIVLRRCDRTAPLAVVDELSGAFARGWQDVHNAEGSGRLSLGNDDADLAGLDFFDVVRFELDGSTRFAMQVEQKTTRAVTSGEEVDEVTEISGRGLVSILEDAVVYPVEPLGRSRFSENRIFNFGTPELNDAGWSPAVATSIEDEGWLAPGWPDSGAAYLWDRFTGVDVVGVPGGDVYFRHWFTTADELTVDVYIAADDEFDAFLDGLALSSDRFNPSDYTPEKTRVTLAAGDHLLAIRGRNLNDLRASVIAAVLEVNPGDGSIVGTVASTGFGEWKMLAYPPNPPGFTPGEVLRLLLAEAQARGSALGVTLGFTDGADSSGEPWPVTADLSFAVGSDLLSVVKQMSETYFDFAMTPSLVLDAWASRGRTTTVSFTEGENLVELTHEGKV